MTKYSNIDMYKSQCKYLAISCRSC